MSFVCQTCDKVQGNGTKPMLVVIERRNKIYPIRHNKKGEIIDKGGRGYEIVREIQACKPCAVGDYRVIP